MIRSVIRLTHSDRLPLPSTPSAREGGYGQGPYQGGTNQGPPPGGWQQGSPQGNWQQYPQQEGWQQGPSGGYGGGYGVRINEPVRFRLGFSRGNVL
jgi:hypothetical protein